MSTLRADVYVAPSAPAAPARPGGTSFSWSPIASTLIRAKSSAVLVDTPITIAQTADLIKWIEELIPHKNLVALYITHGHADHFMGIPSLLAKFPDMKILATVGTIAHMREQLEPSAFRKMWATFFPGGQVPDPSSIRIAESLPSSGEFELEGHVLRAVEVGHSDTYDTTVLHIPNLEMVVAGDVVYGDVHQYLVEANTKAKRQEWIRAIEKIEALKPKIVVAGHKRPGAVDGIFNLQTSKQYLRDFDALIDTGVQGGKELYKAMMEKYGGRVNSHALLGGCLAATAGHARI